MAAVTSGSRSAKATTIRAVGARRAGMRTVPPVATHRRSSVSQSLCERIPWARSHR